MVHGYFPKTIGKDRNFYFVEASPEVEYVDKGIVNFAEIAHVGKCAATLQ